MVPFIGLTGGIGAGKSTALAALERLGAVVLSTDAVVHELYESDEVRDAVVARFGSLVAPGGTVDRGALAKAAFARPEGREWLEGLLWPRVGQRIVELPRGGAARRPAAARRGGRGAAVVRVGHEPRLRRHDRGDRRRGDPRPAGGRPRPRGAGPALGPAALAGGKVAASDVYGGQRRSASTNLEAKLSSILAMLER